MLISIWTLLWSQQSIMVRGNAGSVLIALEKLADNAIESIQFLAPPQGRISVSLSVTNGSMAQIVMADNGGGIVPGQEEQIFQPFFTTKSVKGHLGLGSDSQQRFDSIHVRQHHC